ncbi:MAG: hypothetical protein AB1529_03325 [Candidatus Micrarchaeota archaeon]
MKDIRRRNLKIFRLREEEATKFSVIAKRFGISEGRASQVYLETKRKEAERATEGTLFELSGRARNIIRKISRNESPTLIDLQRLIEELNNEHGNWRVFLHNTKYCGKKTINEIIKFALAKGIPKKTVAGWCSEHLCKRINYCTGTYVFENGERGYDIPIVRRVQRLLRELTEKHGDWKVGIEKEFGKNDSGYFEHTEGRGPAKVIPVIEQFIKAIPDVIDQ